MAEEVKMDFAGQLDADLRERRDAIAATIAELEQENTALKATVVRNRETINDLLEKIARYNMALGLKRDGEPRKPRSGPSPASPEPPTNPLPAPA